MNRYCVEMLTNGLIRIFDYAAKTAALFTPDGKFHSGDDTIPFVEAICTIFTSEVREMGNTFKQRI